MVYTKEKIKYLIKLRHHIKYSIKKLLKNRKSKRDIFFDNLKLKMKNREIFKGISYFDTLKESNCRLLKTKKFDVLKSTEKEVVCLFYHPKEYDNFGVLYYQGQDIEKEDPMIVENADDYIYTPTLESKDKDPLPSTSYKELQDRFTRKFNELYYPEEFTKEGNPKSFWGIIDSLQAGINYARNCMEFRLKENHSKDDFTLCEYYAKVLDTYLRTVDELDLGILFVSDCDVRKTWSERNPMIVENADDFIFTPTLNSENKDPLPSTEKQTTDKSNVSVDPIKLDEDWMSNVKEYLKDKERKVSHPDEDLLIRITKLIFEWCETIGIDPSSAKYHILAELYSMMRRFVMLKTSEEKKENKND